MLYEEYNIVDEFKIPIASSIDNAPANKLRDFMIIREEIYYIKKYLAEKDNNGNRR